MTIVPYAKRKITVTIRLGNGDGFGYSGFNTLTLTGLRVMAQIKAAILPHPGEAIVTIWGMTLDQINQISQAGLLYRMRNNSVAVQAGDDTMMTTVFNGLITQAAPVFDNQPDSPFVITASPGPGIALPPVPPNTFSASASVETILQAVLRPVGLRLENNGVDTVLSDQYLPGTTADQIFRVLKAADALGTIDLNTGVLAIWPKNSGRGTPSVPEISVQTGMIGYPQFQAMQVVVRSLFDPDVGGVGTKIKIVSQLAAANGMWNLQQKDYFLSSEMPGGPWEMLLMAVPDEGAVGNPAIFTGQAPWQAGISAEPPT